MLGNSDNNKNKKNPYRISDIQCDKRVFLTPKDVAKALGVSESSLVFQLENSINSVPFPVVKVGKTILFPRKKFLDYLGYDDFASENDYFESSDSQMATYALEDSEEKP